MSIIQWILLVAVIVVVGGAYWYLRRHNGSDPWQGMNDERSDEEVDAQGESLGGDSYIVGVRTIGDAAPRAKSDGAGPDAGDEFDADAAWSAFKKAPETAPAPTHAAARAPEMAPVEPVPPQEAQTRPTEPVLEPTASARVENIRPVQPPAGEESIFQLHVAAPKDAAFDGPDIHAALDAEGLKFGPSDFYHRVTDANGQVESVYCIANMAKPGTLDPVDQDHLRTPGLTMFLILPGPIEGVRAMRDMMETANTLATALGGQVLDDQRLVLKAQSAQYILDQIAELDRQARLRKAR